MNKSSKIVPSSPQPLHISQAFNLQTADENFDFLMQIYRLTLGYI